MRILVTGATGFIGNHLTKRLTESGHQVRALVRKQTDATLLEQWGVEIFRGDLNQMESLEGCCENIDAVIHSACAVASTFDAGRQALELFLAVNRDGTLNLAREVLKHENLRFVHVSSTAAMGPPKTTHVDESSPCHPQTPYQISKREAEIALLELHRNEGLNVVILRPCHVTGEGKEDVELIKMFKLVRRGLLPYIGFNMDLQKPLVMVDDVVDALILAIDKGQAGEIYLIHSDGDHTMGEIIKTAGRLTGAKRTHFRIPIFAARFIARALRVANRFSPNWNPPLTPERVELFIADRKISVEKAKRELGFSPQHQDLESMLGRTYQWLRSEGIV